MEKPNQSPSELATARVLITNSFEEKGARLESVIVPKFDHYIAILTFAMIGVTQLLIWNMMLSYSNALQRFVWPGNFGLDLLGGTEHAVALLVSLIMIKLNGLSTFGCLCWTIINSVLCVLFPFIPAFLHGNENYATAEGLIIPLFAALGACAGMMHVYGFAFASIMPTDYVVWVSTGNGIAGAFCFFVFIILTAIFPGEAVETQLTIGWIFFITAALLGIVQFVLFWFLSGREWFQTCVTIAQNKKATDVESNLKTWGPRRSLWAIFKDCWVQAMNSAFTLFITLVVYPSSGPFGWGKSYVATNFLNGTFQVMDLVARWFPALGGWTKIPKKYLWIFVVLRPVVMLPLFIIPVYDHDLPFLSNLVWLFFLITTFTLTNGVFVSLGAMYCPECVEHPEEKEIASEIFVASTLSCVTAGIYMSKLPLLGK